MPEPSQGVKLVAMRATAHCSVSSAG
jgi:hypothetical protein